MDCGIPGLPVPSPSPGVSPVSCPLNQWCYPTVSSSATLFSFYLQSFPSSGSFPMRLLFTSTGQSMGALASVLPMNTEGWFPLEWTGLISLQSKGLSRVFSNTTVRKHQLILWCSAFFMVQLSHLYMTTGNTIDLTMSASVYKWVFFTTLKWQTH